MRFKKMFLFAAVTCISSCEPELVGVVKFGESSLPTENVVFNIGYCEDYATKTSLGSDVENIFTGAVLAAYHSDTGLIDSEIYIPADKMGGSISIGLPKGKYDFYLTGNMWNVRKSDGTTTGVGFPASETDVSAMFYRIDGKDVDSDYRRETFSEISKFGIPLCWSAASVDITSSGPLNIQMRRLLSKLTVTIDHSGISGTELSDFENGSLHIRQANCKIAPFDPQGSKAVSSQDIIETGDYDSAMENGLLKEFVFYVPENRQGVLMPGNSDPYSKDMDGVENANGNNGVSKMLTYVEFTGRLSNANTGLGGVAVYRFFLGRNATTDFDITRNNSMKVLLGFNVNSLFKAEWKIDVDDVTDGRQFYLSGELAGRLPDGKEIAVRKNRPGKVSLNIRLSEGGMNCISTAALVDRGYNSSSIRDIAWSSDCWSRTHDALNEPQRKALAGQGIGVNYEAGDITFSVIDASLFTAGKRIPVSFTLYPGGRKLDAVIKTLDDISVSIAGGSDLSTDFYVAQKRTLAFSGFAGRHIYYAADQGECGAAYGGLHKYNRQWKSDRKLSSPYAFCKTDAEGNIVYPCQDTAYYYSQRLSHGEILDIYAFYPNDFVWKHSYHNSVGNVIICSEDVLNDGIISVPLKIEEPYYQGYDFTKIARLPIDGTEYQLPHPFMDISRKYYLGPSDFEPDLYKELLFPEISYDSNTCKWMECVRIDPANDKMYIDRISCSAGKLKDASLDSSNLLGSFIVTPNDATGLYGTSFSYLSCSLSRPALKVVGGPVTSDYFNESGTSSTIKYTATVDFPGGDSSRYKCSESGPSVQYRCKSYPYDVITSVIDVSVRNVYDYVFLFDEASQVAVAPNGEKVPGGLLVPYGTHKLTLEVTNKWDGGVISLSGNIDFKYYLSLGQLGIFSPSRYATIYMLPQKNATYMMNIGPEVTSEARKWMLKVLETNEWMNHLATSPSYYNPETGKYYVSSVQYTHPISDYDVKFVNSYASAWTRSIAQKSYEASGYLWLNNLKIVDSGHNEQPMPNSDPLYTGSSWLKIFCSTTRCGYVFLNSGL